MAQQKYSHDLMMDTGLNWIKTTATRIAVCTTYPTTKALANTGYCICFTACTSTSMTLGDGTSGRKLTVAQKASISIGGSGSKDALHIALYAHPGTYLCYVTTCVTQTLTAGNTVTIPSWGITIADPT